MGKTILMPVTSTMAVMKVHSQPTMKGACELVVIFAEVAVLAKMVAFLLQQGDVLLALCRVVDVLKVLCRILDRRLIGIVPERWFISLDEMPTIASVMPFPT